ncbi:nucleoside 2-deoxyribosyltransferase [Candidatus Acetothermia bacterium]|nr:nucleoside 2-deoxyribosyltransferase [Candidatus Acetothermia bacterium]
MIITLCGSMRFKQQMDEVVAALRAGGHQVHTPIAIEGVDYLNKTQRAQATLKKEHDLIRKHFEKITQSDAILVLNYDTHETKNYIGGHTLLEMGVAFYLGKRIYLLNPIPEMPYTSEMAAMEPTILNGSLNKLDS